MLSMFLYERKKHILFNAEQCQVTCYCQVHSRIQSFLDTFVMHVPCHMPSSTLYTAQHNHPRKHTLSYTCKVYRIVLVWFALNLPPDKHIGLFSAECQDLSKQP